MYAVDDTGGRRMATAAEGAAFVAEREASEQKHTPGPWHAKRDGEVWNEDEAMFRPARNFDIITPSQTTYANAALIAAAPDMYEALRTARTQVEAFCDTCDKPDPDTEEEPCEFCPLRVLDGAAFDALAKAEGRA